MKASASFGENPLYEKLCRRFSYSGKTVGEMMLSRANEEEKSGCAEISDITAEARITRANALPKQDGAACAAVRRAPLFSVRRINPSAVLAVMLLTLICTYLLVAGISRKLPRLGEGLLDTPTEMTKLYTPPLAPPFPLSPNIGPRGGTPRPTPISHIWPL